MFTGGEGPTVGGELWELVGWVGRWVGAIGVWGLVVQLCLATVPTQCARVDRQNVPQTMRPPGDAQASELLPSMTRPTQRTSAKRNVQG